MQLSLVARTLGILLMLFSASLVPPLVFSWAAHDGEAVNFSIVLLTGLSVGVLLFLLFDPKREHIRIRDGFIIVALMWVTMSGLGSLPFMYSLGMSPADAVFEATSGVTTTGSTVILGLDALPPSILLFRQELQWLGGIGIVVAAVALLPMLGIGGMQLYRAETPGPMKEDKLTPRIASTARALCGLYVSMTAACALLYWLAGMSAFDAVAHAMTTLATGGYSTHDASFAYFDSQAIELIAIVFMLLGAINFSIHYVAWQNLNPGAYWRNTEVRAFLLLVLAVVGLVAMILYFTGAAPTVPAALRLAAFEVVSVVTTTGYGIQDFSVWPLALPVLLIFVSFMGGCGGSTSGGMKVIRFVILARQASIQVQRLIHPQLVRSLKVGERVIPDHVIDAIWGFFVLYVITFAVTMLLLMMDGMDQVTAFGAVATCMNNLGPGLGRVATDFVVVSDTSKYLLAFAMIAGRLEIFTILVLLTPAFWRG